MEKNLSALGFMSGTSGDGVDTSVISSNGKDTINIKYNRFDPYPTSLSNKIHRVKESISEMQDLLKYSTEIDELELEITDFHIDIAIKAIKEVDYDLIGFHGHTIYHNTEEKISKQIGLGANLSKLTNKDVVYNFRQNDIKNGGEGAPLSPIYHLALIKSLFNENKVKIPISILNIGGIANITEIDKDFKITSRDIGPGNCLIDMWVRKNSNKLFDENGNFAEEGKTDNRVIFLEKLIKKMDGIKYDFYGIGKQEPVWGNEFYKSLLNSKMALNLSRGEPTKHYSSNRIASLMGNGLLVFIDKKVKMNNFFNSNEIVSYDHIDDLAEKIKFYKKNDKSRIRIAKKGKEKYFKLFNEVKISKYIIDKSL